MATTASAAPQTPVQDDGADVVIQPKPKLRQIRNTASGIQKRQVNKFDATDHSKRVFKRATSWYKQELEKNDGLSSREIAKRVKLEFDDVGPSAKTLQWYVDNGIAGQSPLKPGIKSDSRSGLISPFALRLKAMCASIS